MITYDLEAAVCRVGLDRPEKRRPEKRNAFSLEMLGQLGAAMVRGE